MFPILYVCELLDFRYSIGDKCFPIVGLILNPRQDYGGVCPIENILNISYIFRVATTLDIVRDNIKAPLSSRRGSVITFKGATRDFAHNNRTCVIF